MQSMSPEILNFITTNAGKAASLYRRLPEGKYILNRIGFELQEIQADSPEIISRAKGHEAVRLLGIPAITHDTSFHISALNGYPGVYVKPVLGFIDLAGLLKQMQDVEDRNCYFEGALTYTTIDGNQRTFVSRNYGLMGYEIAQESGVNSWGGLAKIFIPHGFDKVLGLLTDEERAYRSKTITKDSEFAKFVEWLEFGKPI